MATPTFPNAIWQGHAPDHSPDLAHNKAPDYKAWQYAISEIKAVQTEVLILMNRGSNITIGAGPIKEGLVITEQGNDAVHKTVFTMTATPIVSTDGATPAIGGATGSQLLYTFPEGVIKLFGAHMMFPLSGLEAITGGDGGFNNAAEFRLGVGTVSALYDDDVFTLSATQKDIISEMQCELSDKKSNAMKTKKIVSSTAFDGSSVAKKTYLNFRCMADGDHGLNPDVLEITGTLTLFWTLIGDS